MEQLWCLKRGGRWVAHKAVAEADGCRDKTDEKNKTSTARGPAPEEQKEEEDEHN